MQALFTSYWYRFLHPIKYKSFNLYKLSFSEIVLISWIFGIIKATYSVIFLNFSMIMNKFSLIGIPPQLFSQKWYLYGILIETLFFPIYIWVAKQVWFWVISFFNQLYNHQSEDDEVHEILNISFSSHILLLVPFLGKPLHYILNLIYIYLGLRNRLLMSRLQSWAVILSPLIFVALFFLVIFVLFMVFILLAKY